MRKISPKFMPNFTTPLAEKNGENLHSALLQGSCSDDLNRGSKSTNCAILICDLNLTSQRYGRNSCNLGPTISNHCRCVICDWEHLVLVGEGLRDNTIRGNRTESLRGKHASERVSEKVSEREVFRVFSEVFRGFKSFQEVFTGFKRL